MTFVSKSRVHESTQTTGTGAVALAGATADHRTFGSVMALNDTCWYCINFPGNNQWEVGLGTYSGTNTLSRTTLLESSTGSAINFTAGTKDVYMGLPGYYGGSNLNQIEETLTAAATTDLGSVGTRRVAISGTTGITSFGTAVHQLKHLRFLTAGSPDVGVTITHNATSLICPAARNFTAYPGDTAIVTSDASGNWRILQVTRAINGPGSSFEPNTSMLFFQATPPTYWTKQTGHNDKALRVVSGSGGGAAGTSAFTTVFSNTISTNNFTLTTAEMPSHAHGTSETAHRHGLLGQNALAGTPFYVACGSNVNNNNPDASAMSTTSTALSVTANGSGGAHAHGMDLRVQYIDIINATKD